MPLGAGSSPGVGKHLLRRSRGRPRPVVPLPAADVWRPQAICIQLLVSSRRQLARLAATHTVSDLLQGRLLQCNTRTAA